VSEPRHLPRSNYAAKLGEFSDFVFTEGQACARGGRWREFLRSRIGPKFDGRVMLELGCSDGTLLTTVAAKYPDTAFVGLDWKCKPLHDCASRVASRELRNVALLRARGQDVGRIFGDGEVEEIWLFHPDPCDTAVELKNRLMGEAFLKDALRVLREGGTLALKTDHAEYHQWTVDLLRGRSPGALRLVLKSDHFWEDEQAQRHTKGHCFAGLTTPFEARFLKKRQPIYYVEIRKQAGDEKSRPR
jgi:tRNA (guanine-N7-)-methyltransferase